MTEVIIKEQAPVRLRILVVEDSDVEKLIFLKMFPGIHTIYMASGTKEGWKLYLENLPHIVFMDIGLPDGNGNDLARMMKEQNPATYIVMATSNNDRENKTKAVHNRVDGFIVKPINKNNLNDHIERFLIKTRRACL